MLHIYVYYHSSNIIQQDCLRNSVGWLCIHWGVRNTTDFVGVGLGRVGGQVKGCVWAAWGLFGDEIAVFVKGVYVELFICC